MIRQLHQAAAQAVHQNCRKDDPTHGAPVSKLHQSPSNRVSQICTKLIPKNVIRVQIVYGKPKSSMVSPYTLECFSYVQRSRLIEESLVFTFSDVGWYDYPNLPYPRIGSVAWSAIKPPSGVCWFALQKLPLFWVTTSCQWIFLMAAIRKSMTSFLMTFLGLPQKSQSSLAPFGSGLLLLYRQP